MWPLCPALSLCNRSKHFAQLLSPSGWGGEDQEAAEIELCYIGKGSRLNLRQRPAQARNRETQGLCTGRGNFWLRNQNFRSARETLRLIIKLNASPSEKPEAVRRFRISSLIPDLLRQLEKHMTALWWKKKKRGQDLRILRCEMICSGPYSHFSGRDAGPLT